jgi:3-keto-5-aminohexanoate cleavage enzyme
MDRPANQVAPTSIPVIVTVAPTGPLATTAQNDSLPVTPEQIAVAATRAHAAGASVVHVHVRDEQQRPSADLDTARRTLELIRDSSPIHIQLSTGVGFGVPFEDRARLVELRPTMATLNPCTMSFGTGEFFNPPDKVQALALRMRELGIRPELEVYDTGHLEACLRLLDEGVLEAPLQFSLVMGVRGGMAANPRNLVHLIDRLPPGSIWQVITIGRPNLEMTAIGLAMGGNARAGLEDTLWLRRGEPATNDSLVTRLVEVTRTLDRRPSTVEETAATLRLRTDPVPGEG